MTKERRRLAGIMARRLLVPPRTGGHIGLLLIGLSLACQKPVPKAAPGFFTDITEQSHLHFIHDPGVDGTHFMPESLGSGGAFFDYNNDGLLDIYLVNAGPHS